MSKQGSDNDYTVSPGAFALRNLRRWRFLHIAAVCIVLLAFVLNTLSSSALQSLNIGRADDAARLDLKYCDAMVFLLPYLSATIPTSIATLAYYDACVAVKVDSNLGEIELLGLPKERTAYNLPAEAIVMGHMPEYSGEMVLPHSLAASFDITVGDIVSAFTIFYQSPISLNFTVVGVYRDDFDYAPIFVDYDDAYSLLGDQSLLYMLRDGYLTTNTRLGNADSNGYGADRILFTLKEGVSSGTLVNALKRVYPDFLLVYGETPMQRAVQNAALYNQSIMWLLPLIWLFLAVAIYTLDIILYYEKKKQYSALKSLGSSFKQVLQMTLQENVSAKLLGLLLGIALTLGCFFAMPQFIYFSFAAMLKLMVVTLAGCLAVIALSQAYPLLLVRQASVNQLLYSRIIPIMVSRIRRASESPEVRQREANENVRLLKLPTVGTELDCLLLRSSGKVKQGETLAVLESLNGLYLQEWISPVDGEVVAVEVNGVVVIKPAESL